MTRNRLTLALVLSALAFLLFAGLLLGPRSVWAKGGEGIGITAEVDSVAGSPPDTTAGGWGNPNFVRFEAADNRIRKDINFLVSESFAGGLALSNDEKNGFLRAVDDSINNEYDFQIHDFGLTFNYFACSDTVYGAYQGDYNVLFKLGPQDPSNPNYYGVPERNHLDYFLALYGVDADNYGTKTTGRYTSAFYDADEDPPYEDEDPAIDTKYHLNSCEGYDGVTGVASADSLRWYFSGKHANLMFVHEFQHLCYQSQTNPSGLPVGGWPNEFFSTAAEYLGGTLKGGFPWNLFYDVRCDDSVIGDSPSRFQTWRLLATYLFHQFDESASSYSDDLMYAWLRRSDVSPTAYRGLYHLAKELENAPWSPKLTGADGAAKLGSLFQDWAIAKAVNDSTRYAPGDSITLGFKRGFSPYYDIGLFWDVDATCCAANSKVLPHEHVVNQSSIDNFAWVTSYTCHEDSVWGTCPDCKGGPLTVAQKADGIDVPTWGSDYVLFKASSLESGGPYDLKIKIRGDGGNVPPADNRIQVAVLTYSSADSVFRTPENLLEVRKVAIDPDSAKANVTICGFGDSIKAAVLIVGLAYENTDSGLDYYNAWNYKYGYTVEKHWKSGAIPWSVTWFDSVHVAGTVIVPEGLTLGVEAGTRMDFCPGCSLKVEGTLEANGAPNEVALLLPAAGSSQPGDWAGIYCDGTLEMSSCSVQCPKTGIRLGDWSDVSLDHCCITDCLKYGIVMSGSEAALEVAESTVETPRKDGVGILLFDGAHASIGSTTITGDPDSLTYGVKCDGALGATEATLTGVTISGQKYGIYSSNSDVYTEGCGIDDFSSAGIYFLGSSSHTCSVKKSTFGNAASGATGIYVYGSPATTILRDTVECVASSDKTGIQLEGVGQGNPGTATVDSCLVSGFQNALYASYMDIAVSNSVFTDFTNDGIKAHASEVEITYDSLYVGSTGVRGIELTSTSSGTVSHNKITGSGSGVTYGIELKDAAAPALQYNWIEGVKYGIKTVGSSVDISHNRIKGTTGNGIQCGGTANPVVRYTTIENFQGTGLTALDDSAPDLGAEPDSGSNRIYAGSSYYVANLAEENTLMAELNWWGTATPSAKKFYGDVDYTPLCTTDPGTSYALPLPLVPFRGPVAPYVTQNYPNPFNPQTTIEYGVTEPGTRVKIVVYDISGRVVRVLLDEARPPGHHAVIWDGRNSRAEPVVSGVYVCDVTVGSLREQKKLVVLR